MRGELSAGVIATIFLSCTLLGSTEAKPAPQGPVVLQEGRFGSFLWGVSVSRDNGRRGGQRPCLGSTLIDTKPANLPSGFTNETYAEVCSPLPPNSPPNIVSVNFGKGLKRVTVVGIAFEPKVEVAQLNLGDKSDKRVILKLLTNAQMRKAHVRQIRYGSLVVRGKFCLEQALGLTRSGEEVYQGPSRTCR